MITSGQVMQQLAHLGANPISRMLLDEKFAVADQASMVDFWAKYYEALKVMDLLDWSEEDWDCEDFAIIAWGFMKAAYRKTHKHEGVKVPAGINLGVFAYENAKMQANHMINFQPTPEGVIFFEPQPQNGRCGTPVELTTDEAWSCFAYAI